MRVATALVLACLFLLTPHAVFGAESVAVAQKALDAARAELSAAVKRTEVEPPATADLDAAHAAVNALKDVIDAGAAREPEDLDYAKAALAARKELRTSREYVDQRRAKVHIFNHRRVIDEALATSKERAKVVEGKEPAPADFEAARAALAALKKAADEGRPFTAQDQKYASYLADIDATLAKQQKAIDDRWVLLSADTHRALVEERRAALTAALAPLAKGATDAQFETADQALKALTAKLEEGKPLESDKTYRPIAATARNEATSARKKMDELWTATGLARLKGEVEPTYQDLKVGLRNVRSKKATDEQLAEARTVAIVMRKLVEKFQPEATRSEAFGQYMEGVKVALNEVELQLQLRGLEAARQELSLALRNIEKPTPSDDHFAEANSALLILEKTLEPVVSKDALIEPTAADARWMLKEAKTKVAKRRVEVDVDRQRTRVEAARKNADTKLALATQNTALAAQLDEAQAAVAAIGVALDAGTTLMEASKEYAWYDREVRKRIDEQTGKIAKGRIALAGRDGRTALTEALATARTKLETAKQPAGTDADLAAAGKAMEALALAVESRVELEPQDWGYGAAAEKTRNAFFGLQENFEVVRQLRDLRKRTGEALATGAAAFEAGQAAKELRTQKTQYEKALAAFKACRDEGTNLLEGTPGLERVVVLLDGQPSNPKVVVAQCTTRFESLSPLMKPLIGLIAFEEGPKRSYEKARTLLAQGKKTEALAEFDECTATGLTVQHRNPDLRERSFDLAGGAKTLIELVRECGSQARTLRGK